MIAGESSEHPPTVALNPAAVIAAPTPMFPTEIAALRREIAAETDRLAREHKILVAMLVSKDESITPEAVGALAETLDTARARIRERRAILDSMLEAHRRRIARTETDTPFDPVAADAATPQD